MSTISAAVSPALLNREGAFYPGFLSKRRGTELVYGTSEQAVIEGTVARLLGQPTSAKKPGILLGQIQSGKTKTFLGVIALGFDNGYDIAIILTKPTTALAKQTLKRVHKEFAEFIEADEAKVYDILELPERLTQYELSQKQILVVKKQTHNLDRLSEALLTTYPQLADKRILIVDDEADNASIGYSNDKTLGLHLRTIAEKIDVLRRHLPQASFLQVTATPYSLYLQPEESPIPTKDLAPVRPTFRELVPVHPDYVGGRFYFEESALATSPAAYVFKPVTSDELLVLRQPDGRRFKTEDCLTSEKVTGLRQALVTFVVAACLRRLQDDQDPQRRPKRYAFLFHTEAGRAAHAWQEDVIVEFDRQLQTEAATQSALLRKLVQAAYDDLSRSVVAAAQPLPAFADVWERVVHALTSGEIMITKVNSEAQVAALLDDEGQLRLRTPLNIFIGGQILDRGVTIANLIGFYYGRDPQKFQQDTVLQHSRMYGFRPPQDRAVTRFYTAPHIYVAMRRMHEADSALRERIENSHGDQSVTFIELDANNTIIPCSPTKILASNITTLRPHRRVVPAGFETDAKVRLRPLTDDINHRLTELVGRLPAPGENPPATDIALDDALDLLARISPAFVHFAPGYEDTWELAEYQAILRHLSENTLNPANRGRMLVMLRTGRNVSRKPSAGAHAEFNEPDTTRTDGAPARAAAVDLPVLLLIRQEGAAAQGWSDTPFWWPVLVTPERMRTTLFAHSR